MCNALGRKIDASSTPFKIPTELNERSQRIFGQSLLEAPDFGVATFVNEEGPLRRLQLDAQATFLWWVHVPEARQRATLVRDAVVVGFPTCVGRFP